MEKQLHFAIATLICLEFNNIAVLTATRGESEEDMTKTVFNIDDLSGYAWECAIKNVYKVLVANIGLENLDLREAMRYEAIARELNIKFDVNGDII